MRKFFVTLMTSLLACSSAFAFWPEALSSNGEIGIGYRRDNLKFETRVNTDTSGLLPAVAPMTLRSKVEFNDLDIVELNACGRYVTCDNIYLRSYGDYGWICDGKTRDRDSMDDSGYSNYSGGGSYGNSGSSYGLGGACIAPNLAVLNAGSISDTRHDAGGHVYDASIGAGYQFKLCDESFGISPLAGYSWHGQHVHIRDSDSSCSSSYDSSLYYSDTYSDYGRLRSKYHTRWDGPFVGFDFDYALGCSGEWNIFGSYEYHWAWYHAKADWNMRADLANGFHQRSRRAWGQIATLGLAWDFCDCYTASIFGRFQYFEARHGRDRAKICTAEAGDIKVHCNQTIPLRRVEWYSGSVSVDIGMVF